MILLYVRVTLETSIERNKRRNRCVPNEVLQDYSDKMEDAVDQLRMVADEVVFYDNNEDNSRRVLDLRSHLLQWWRSKQQKEPERIMDEYDGMGLVDVFGQGTGFLDFYE